MYYHYPYIEGSAYMLWKKLLCKKVGLKQLKMISHPFGGKNMYRLLYQACDIGDLSSIMAIVNIYDIDWNLDYGSSYSQIYPIHSMNRAVRNNHLHIVKWLYNVGCQHNKSVLMRYASFHGHLRIVKWLYSIGCDLIVPDNIPIRSASQKGHLHVVKWLHKMLSKRCDEAVEHAAYGGHLHIIKWLYHKGYDMQFKSNLGMRLAKNKNYSEVVVFLESVN